MDTCFYALSSTGLLSQDISSAVLLPPFTCLVLWARAHSLSAKTRSPLHTQALPGPFSCTLQSSPTFLTCFKPQSERYIALTMQNPSGPPKKQCCPTPSPQHTSSVFRSSYICAPSRLDILGRICASKSSPHTFHLRIQSSTTTHSMVKTQPRPQ